MTIHSIPKAKEEFWDYNLCTVFLWFPIFGAFFSSPIHFWLCIAF